MEEITLDVLMQMDRYYFEQHPDAREYIREYILGELPNNGLYPVPRYVRVIKISRGIRVRQPLNQLPIEGGK